MPALNQELSDQIKQICATGYEHYDQGDFAQATRLFYQAWIKLPKPQTDYLEAGWVLTALGDAYFRQEKYTQAIEALNSALFCPGLSKNPFVQLRLGQSQFRLGNLSPARSALFKAYKVGGKALFEKESGVYLDAISDLTTTIPG